MLFEHVIQKKLNLRCLRKANKTKCNSFDHQQFHFYKQSRPHPLVSFHLLSFKPATLRKNNDYQLLPFTCICSKL